MKEASPGLLEAQLAKAGDQSGPGVWRRDSPAPSQAATADASAIPSRGPHARSSRPPLWNTPRSSCAIACDSFTARNRQARNAGAMGSARPGRPARLRGCGTDPPGAGCPARGRTGVTGPSGPARYQIRIDGVLDDRWADWWAARTSGRPFVMRTPSSNFSDKGDARASRGRGRGIRDDRRPPRRARAIRRPRRARPRRSAGAGAAQRRDW